MNRRWLVAHRDRAQEVKTIVSPAEAAGASEGRPPPQSTGLGHLHGVVEGSAGR